jgi:hypothetical protein
MINAFNGANTSPCVIIAFMVENESNKKDTTKKGNAVLKKT